METPTQEEASKTDGYNEVVKEGQSMKIVMVVVIFLILAVLVGYILMNYFGAEAEPEIVNPTAVPTVEATVVQEQPLASQTSEVVTLTDFSFNIFNSVSNSADNPYIVSGKALSDADLIPTETSESASFTVQGDGYQLNVAAFYESEQISYEDFVSLMKIGDETVARVKDNYLMTPQHQYRYVRTENFDETQDCEGIGPDEMLTAPCGYSHYVRGNEVQTFYILDITCDADDEYVSKCDDIVKSLQVSV
jgi:hypothetical protein